MTTRKSHKNSFATKKNKIEKPNRYAEGKWERRETTGDHGGPPRTTGGTGSQGGRQREATGGNRGKFPHTDFDPGPGI